MNFRRFLCYFPPGILKTISGSSIYGVAILLILLDESTTSAKILIIYSTVLAVSALISNWVEQAYIRFQDNQTLSEASTLVIGFSVLSWFYLWLALGGQFSLLVVVLSCAMLAVESIQRIHCSKMLIEGDVFAFNLTYFLRFIFESSGVVLVVLLFPKDVVLQFIILIFFLTRTIGYRFWVFRKISQVGKVNLISWFKYGLPVTLLTALPAILTTYLLLEVHKYASSDIYINAIRIFTLIISIPSGVHLVKFAPEIFSRLRNFEAADVPRYIIANARLPIAVTLAVSLVAALVVVYGLDVPNGQKYGLCAAIAGSLLWSLSLYMIKPIEIGKKTYILSVIMIAACALTYAIYVIFPSSIYIMSGFSPILYFVITSVYIFVHHSSYLNVLMSNSTDSR